MTFTILFLLEMYGFVTVKDGKHLHRALEARFYLSLYIMYVGMFIDRYRAIKKEIKEDVVYSILYISE